MLLQVLAGPNWNDDFQQNLNQNVQYLGAKQKFHSGNSSSRQRLDQTLFKSPKSLAKSFIKIYIWANLRLLKTCREEWKCY